MVETGLGGLTDATNVFAPEQLQAAVITPLGGWAGRWVGQWVGGWVESWRGVRVRWACLGGGPGAVPGLRGALTRADHPAETARNWDGASLARRAGLTGQG